MNILKVTEKFSDDLTGVARDLLGSLEDGNAMEAYKCLGEIHKIKEQTLFFEIGKMTRALHNALVHFELDENQVNFSGSQNGQQISDASERLKFVIQTTEDAANKTMDMVEDTVPIAVNLGSRARALKTTWSRLIKRELSADEFRALYGEMDQFLDETIENSNQLNTNLNSILLAQDFQDITGQVLKKVITIVHDVQMNLVELVKLAAALQSFSGDSVELEKIKKEDNTHKDNTHKDELNEGADESSCLEGPIINKEQRDDVVNNQDEVDNLLSSLGF